MTEENKRTPLDIMVPVHGRKEMTVRCMDALFSYTASPFHLIIMDDTDASIEHGSFHAVDPLDRTAPYLEKLASVRSNVTYLNLEKPFQTGNQFFNFALRYCKYDYFATVMNSTIVQPEHMVTNEQGTFVDRGWETAALQVMEQYQDVGTIGFKCLFPLDAGEHGGKIESAGIGFTKFQPMDIGRGMPSHCLTEIAPRQAVQWAFALHRKRAIVGVLDNLLFNGFVGWDDIDNCMVVASKGWKVLYCGHGVGYHSPQGDRGFRRGDRRTLPRQTCRQLR